MEVYSIVALYCFTPVENPDVLCKFLNDFCVEENIKGGLVVAHEGLNGNYYY